jgi:carbon monoxide dehydrogenase subunit G
MDFDNSFTVAAPIDEVWRTMLDIERVAPCVPGASVIDRSGPDAYKLAMKVKVGPVSMNYNSEVEIVEQDEAARRAVLRAKAKETRGQGTADANVSLELVSDGDGTKVTMHTDVALTGKAASMGSGLISDVSARLIDKFATNLQTMLTAPAAERPTATAGDGGAPSGVGTGDAAPQPLPPAEAQELSALSLVGGVIVRRLRAPSVLAGAIVVIALLFLVRRRRV